MVIPSRREPAREFQVEVRNFLRKEVGFELSPGARLQGRSMKNRSRSVVYDGGW